MPRRARRRRSKRFHLRRLGGFLVVVTEQVQGGVKKQVREVMKQRLLLLLRFAPGDR